jgi:hypothetical protein
MTASGMVEPVVLARQLSALQRAVPGLAAAEIIGRYRAEDLA